MASKSFLETYNNLTEKSILTSLDKENKILLKKFNVKEKDIESAKNSLSKVHKVDKQFLSFYAVWDVGFNNNIFLTFNIEDKSHKNYQSSVNYIWLPEEKRGVKTAKGIVK